MQSCNPARIFLMRVIKEGLAPEEVGVLPIYGRDFMSEASASGCPPLDSVQATSRALSNYRRAALRDIQVTSDFQGLLRHKLTRRFVSQQYPFCFGGYPVVTRFGFGHFLDRPPKPKAGVALVRRPKGFSTGIVDKWRRLPGLGA